MKTALTILVVALSSCAASSERVIDVLPGVDRSTRMHDLSVDEYAEWCRWREDYVGGGYVTCTDGSLLYDYSVEQCVRNPFPSCAYTLGQSIECIVGIGDSCLRGAPIAARACLEARVCGS